MKIFPLQVYFRANHTHFQIINFARGVILKQRYKNNSKTAYLSFFRGFRRCNKKGKLAEHPQIYETFYCVQSLMIG